MCLGPKRTSGGACKVAWNKVCVDNQNWQCKGDRVNHVNRSDC
jgi:hypothetical protein